MTFDVPGESPLVSGTVGFWMRFPDARAARSPAIELIDLSGPSATSNRLTVAAITSPQDGASSGLLQVQAVAGPQTPPDSRVVTRTKPVPWEAGRWRHVALAWQGLDGRGEGIVRVFLDGAEIERLTGVALDLREGPHLCTIGRALEDAGGGKSPLEVEEIEFRPQSIFPGPLIARRVAQERGTDSSAPEPWVGNRLGYSDEAPAPWTPVVVDGDGFSVWNRQYTMGAGHPVFTQMTSGGQELLAAPVALDLLVDGQEPTWDAPVVPEGTPVPAKADALVQGQAGGASLSVKTSVEFDGMARIDVTLDPGQAVRVERLVLKIPLHAAVAKYLHANRVDLTRYSPFYFCLRDTFSGLIPEEGWEAEFYPFITLSNEDVGLCWFAESDELWHPEDRSRAIRIIREGEQVLLEVHMIDRPTVLEKPTVLTFGLQATPVKPLPENWRNWRVFDLSPGMEAAGSPTEGQPTAHPDFPRSPTGEDLGIFWTGPVWSEYFGFPSYRTDTDEHTEIWNEARRNQIDILPYWNAAWVSSGLPEWERHEFDWTAYSFQDDLSSDVMAFNAPIRSVCSASDTWNDFIAYAFDQGIKDSLVTGWYQDGFGVSSCVNAAHGCGYVDDNGQTRPTYPIFARREMFKRLRNIFHSHHPDAPFLGHVSFQIQPPVTGLADAMLGGEHLGQPPYTLKGSEAPPFDGWYATRLPPDTFFAEYSGRHLGIVPFVFTQVHDADPDSARRKTAHMMGLFLVHDAPGVWSRYGDHQTVFRFQRACDDFGLGDAEFVPYWGDAPPASGVPDDVKISAYTRDGKALLIVANLADREATGTLTLDRAALGMKDGTGWSAKDALSGEAVVLGEDMTLDLALPAYGTLLLTLTETP